MSLRYDYLTEADEKPQSASPRQSVFYSRLPVNTLAIPPEAISQDGFLGIFTGGLKACAGGIAAAITAGLLASLVFKARDKS